MNKLQATWKIVARFVDDNLPTILSGMALVGLGATVVTAIKETPKAQEELYKAKTNKLVESGEYAAKDEKLRSEAMDDDVTTMIDISKAMHEYVENSRLTPWEGFKTLAPIYWPCGVSVLATAGCIIGANVVSKKRYLAVAALVAAKSNELKEYQEKVKELFGEKKSEEVKKEIAKDRAMDCPKDLESDYIVGQKYPCHLDGTGLYWTSSRAQIEHAFNKWNEDGLREMQRGIDGSAEIYMEDLIYALGIDDVIKDTYIYRHMSWDLANGLVTPVIETGETVNGVPCLVVRTSRMPDSWGIGMG